MTMPTTIRRATIADAADVGRLFDQYRVFYEQPASAEAATEFVTARLTRDDSLILVAETDGSLSGFTQLYPSFSSVSMAPIRILNDLFVAAAYRRQGIGRLLLLAAAESGKADGQRRLCLATAVDNQPAQALYESLGWKRDSFRHYELELA